MSDLYERIEREVMAREQKRAVRQRFDGSLTVDPKKVFVSRADGRRALARLIEAAKRRE